MFLVSRWAEMFLAASGSPNSGTSAEDAFTCLKAFAVPVKSASGVFFGLNAAEKLESILRDGSKASPEQEYAIRFICLLAEKGCLKHIDSVLERIELMLNRKNKVLGLTVEAAASLDSAFTEELAGTIKEKTGALGVNLKTKVKPELLGGYLLRADGFYIDASLKGQTDKMMKELGVNHGKL